MLSIMYVCILYYINVVNEFCEGFMGDKKMFKSRLVGEGVVIALITAFTYIVAYLYEYGYVTYFGIPKSFISINIVTLLIAAGSIGFIVFTSAHF